MGRDFIVTNSNNTDLGAKKRTVKRGIVIGPNAIRFIAIVIVAILGVVYLSQSTAGASRSIKVRSMETQKGSLELQKERLEAEQTRLKALKEIDNSVEKKVMEPITQVNHLEGSQAVALSR